MLLKVIGKLDLKLAQEWPSFSIWFVISFAFGLLWFLHLECMELKSLLFASSCILICILLLTKGMKYLALFGLSLSAGFILGSAWGLLCCRADLNPPARTYSWIESKATIESLRPTSLGKRKDMVLASLKLVDFKSSFSLMKYGRVAIYFSTYDVEGLSPGDLISFTAKTLNSGGRVLPGGYDFSLQGALNKTDLYGYATSSPLLISKDASKGLKSLIMNVRRQYYKSIKEHLSGDVADFASALIIGESRGLSRSLMSDMRCAGISHVLCVSGLHLTLIASIVFKAFRFLINCLPQIALSCNAKLISAGIAWFGSACYWMLSGMNVATTRAFLMTSAGMVATMLNKRAYSFRTLAFAMLAALLVNPIDILNISFQLSFSAVFALVGSYNLFMPWSAKLKPAFIRKVFGSLLTNLHSSASISLVTAPIAVYHFCVFANYQILGNLLVLPVVGVFLMPMTLICIILIPSGCASVALKLMSFGIEIVVWIADGIANLPHPLLHTGHLSAIAATCSVFGICFLLLWQSRIRFIGLIPILLGFILHMSQGKPDLIFDFKASSVGINRKGQIEIYSGKMSQFGRSYWSNWFGQSQAFYTKADLSCCNLFLQLDKGYKVLILNVPVACIPNDTTLLINNSYAEVQAGQASAINRAELEALGTVAIYFKNEAVQFVGTKGKLVKKLKSKD